MFEHFLITRFNLRNKKWDTTREGHKVLTEAWLENRFRLFESLCLPSIKGQVVKDFRWLIFFDTKTDEGTRSKIQKLSEGASVFEPVFVDGMEAYHPELKRILAESKAEYLITTRLDNDDAVSEDFISTIQDYFDHQDFQPLDFTDGYSLYFQEGRVKIGKRLHINNPFMSLIERKTDDLKTVTMHIHAGWKRERATLHIRRKPLWLTVIHSENYSNKYEGHSTVPADAILRKFHLSPEIAEKISKQSYPASKWPAESIRNKVTDYFNYYFLLLKIRMNFYK